MIIVLHRKHLALPALLLAFMGGMALILWTGQRGTTAFSRETLTAGRHIVVVDAGHGGEDGGAVAADGTVESGLNLEVARRLNDLLAFMGQRTVMTRTEDVSIYSPGAETLHQKKVSDLKNRVELVNGTENAVLLSIHQNSLPSSPKTHGAQVFYNAVPGGDLLAASVQERLNAAVNAGAGKEPKPIGDSVYLMKHAAVPAVIVECGFLSNAADTEALKTPAYQTRLALAVAAGYFSTEELP